MGKKKMHLQFGGALALKGRGMLLYFLNTYTQLYVRNFEHLLFIFFVCVIFLGW